MQVEGCSIEIQYLQGQGQLSINLHIFYPQIIESFYLYFIAIFHKFSSSSQGIVSISPLK